MVSLEKTSGRDFCPRCGTERLDGRFCGACGLDLAALLSPEPTSFTAQYGGISFTQPERSEPAPAHGSTRSGVSPLAVAGFVLLVLAGVAAGFLVLHGQGSAAPLPPAATQATGSSTSTDSVSCVAQVGPFVNALEDLDSRLEVGLTFADYGTRVGDAQVVYDRIDFTAMDPNCLSNVGVPAENALNHYVKAFNAWNACVGKLSCTNAKIKPKLQAEWSAATDILDKIRGTFP